MTTHDLDEQMVEQIVKQVRQGRPWQSAAVVAGVPERLSEDWLERARRGESPYLEFFDRVEAAERACEAELVAMVYGAAATGNKGAARWLHANVRARRLARSAKPGAGRA
jgi:hypothetical protein